MKLDVCCVTKTECVNTAKVKTVGIGRPCETQYPTSEIKSFSGMTKPPW